MDRKLIKTETKNLLNENYPYFLKLFLVVFVLAVFVYIPTICVSSANSFDDIDVWTSYDSLFLSMLLAIFAVSAQYAGIDILKDKSKLTDPFKKCLIAFANGQVFLGSVIVYLLIYVKTFLWTLVLIFPGIIKSMAYSQALFIYRDHILADDPIGYNEALRLSSKLMVGHKWDFFVFQLSFIGYWLLSIVTFGVASIWVIPYYHLSTANYYVHLI